MSWTAAPSPSTDRTSPPCPGELRRRIGMVLQDAWLFEGTIAENIAYGRRDATREEIVAAARAACCDHFIRTLPQGTTPRFPGRPPACPRDRCSC